MNFSRILFLVVVVALVYEASAQSITYVSPLPNSTLVSRKTNIIIRSADQVDPGSLTPAALVVQGALSGEHSGVLSLSDGAIRSG